MRRRVLAVALGGLVATALLVYGGAGVLRVRALRGDIGALQRDVGALQEQARRLTDTAERLRNDPAYIEKLAREEHGLVREGETVLKFPPKAR